MNELEDYLREHRDEPLSNHQPGQQTWEQLQRRLGATEQPKSFPKIRIFLLGLAFLLGTVLVLLLALPEGSVQKSNTDSATSWGTVREPQDVASDTPQQTLLSDAPFMSVDEAEGETDSTYQSDKNSLHPSSKGYSEPPSSPFSKYEVSALHPSAPGSGPSAEKQTPQIPAWTQTDGALTVTKSTTSTDPILRGATQLFPLRTDLLSPKILPPVLPPIVLPERSPRSQDATSPLFRFSLSGDVGLLLGEGGISAIASPIITDPAPGQNVSVQLLPDGSPIYLASEGEEVSLASSAKPWYRFNLGVIYRGHWRLGVELAYGTLSKQSVRSTSRSPDGRFYTLFAREQQAWLFGPSISYGNSLNNWDWSVGLTGLLQTRSTTSSDRLLMTPGALYSSFSVREQERVRQFVPVIDLRTEYRLTRNLSIGPSLSILPLRRRDVFPSDWPDRQTWWSGQMSLSFTW